MRPIFESIKKRLEGKISKESLNESWSEDFRNLIEQHEISITYKGADSNPYMIVSDPTWEARATHYIISVYAGKKRLFNVHFSQGSGIKRQPDVYNIMYSIMMDISGALNANWDADEFAYEFGFDVNDRKIMSKIKRALVNIKKQYEALLPYVGEDGFYIELEESVKSRVGGCSLINESKESKKGPTKSDLKPALTSLNATDKEFGRFVKKFNLEETREVKRIGTKMIELSELMHGLIDKIK